MLLSPDSSETELPTLAAPRLSYRLVSDDRSLIELEKQLAPATEVSIDAERASGFRYGNSAYLIQVGIEANCNWLIDPIALADLPDWQERLPKLLNSKQWILHAATQDLPCLAEVGLVPESLFDTELAARLASVKRFGLAALCEELLGQKISKEHSAADWSIRPLGQDMLNYAALDVEILFAIRDALRTRLTDLGRFGWAQEEFGHIAKFKPKPAAANGWRKLSGSGSLRDEQQQKVASALWKARDDRARLMDVAPGRLLPDSAIIAAATALPQSQSELKGIRAFVGREARSQSSYWWQAIQAADQQRIEPVSQGEIPPHRIWERKFPDAWQRYTQLRDALAPIISELDIPTENLISPGTVRQIAWSPVEIREQLLASGTRSWQIELVLPVISAALQRTS